MLAHPPRKRPRITPLLALSCTYACDGLLGYKVYLAGVVATGLLGATAGLVAARPAHSGAGHEGPLVPRLRLGCAAVTENAAAQQHGKAVRPFVQGCS